MFDTRAHLTSFVLEVTSACNHECIYCYNVWKCPDRPYPSGMELTTEQIKEVIRKLKRQTRIKYLAISGGEPLLRNDIADIIHFCSDNGIDANLLTNGSLLNEENCRNCIDAGTSIFEVPLLTTDAELHRQLTGRDDLSEILQGIKTLKQCRCKLVIVFVATKLNLPHFKQTAETAIALGADGIMFNRFNAGGGSTGRIEQLMPSVEETKEALKILDQLADYYGIGASVSTPIPKCLINPKHFKHINFGYCPSGNKKSYFTIDPYGYVRICNHSPVRLGHFFEEDFAAILKNDYIRQFQKAVPHYCTDCKEVRSCWGGCKAAAEICRQELCDADPFLRRNTSNPC